MCIPFDPVVFQESSQQRDLHNYSKVIQKRNKYTTNILLVYIWFIPKEPKYINNA